MTEAEAITFALGYLQRQFDINENEMKKCLQWLLTIIILLRPSKNFNSHRPYTRAGLASELVCIRNQSLRAE